MTEPTKRRKWRRWVVGLLAVVVLLVGWNSWQSKTLVGRAKALQIGMTEIQVHEIMGLP